MKKILYLALALLVLGCNKSTTPEQETSQTDYTKYYANIFAFNVMNAYYLWCDEVSDGFQSWVYGDDPIEKVASLRYKDSSGNEVDHWTTLMEDCSSFTSSVTGNGKSFGLDFILLRYGDSNVVMEITHTFADSPALEAGIKRGDVFTAVDGEALTMSNYASVLNEKIYDYPGTVTLTYLEGQKVTLSAVQMYSNPVHVAKTLDVDGTKVGYLHFTNFTLDACEDLVEVFTQFKADGVQELVLDLRYNTGGYVFTGTVLASMIAPLSVVKAGEVFNKDIYNAKLSTTMDTETCFSSSFTATFSSGKKTLDAAAANLNLSRLWVIVTGQSASASESLICGLAPYMDLTLVGSNTYGKFCGGYLIEAASWYDSVSKQDTEIDCAEGKKYTDGWGLYVISSRYADCNGVTLSMPSGIPADYEVSDNPRDGYALGDPSESMLAATLKLLSGGMLQQADTKAADGHPAETLPYHRPGFGVLLH